MKGSPQRGMSFIGILKSSGNIGTIDKGKQIHGKILLSIRDIVPWSTLLVGYSQCEQCHEVCIEELGPNAK